MVLLWASWLGQISVHLPTPARVAAFSPAPRRSRSRSSLPLRWSLIKWKVLRNTKPTEPRRVFTGLWMFYWSSAPRMCEFKEHKDTRNVGKSLLQKGESRAVWTGCGGTHKQRLAKVKNSQNTKLALSSDRRNKRELKKKKKSFWKRLNIRRHHKNLLHVWRECSVTSLHARLYRRRLTWPSVFRKQHAHVWAREPFSATLTLLGRRKGCSNASGCVKKK